MTPEQKSAIAAKLSVNLATLKRALNDYNGHSNAHIYIYAAPADIAALQQLAAPKGITIHAL